MGTTSLLTATAVLAAVAGTVAGAVVLRRGAGWALAGAGALVAACLVGIVLGSVGILRADMRGLALVHLVYLGLVLTLPALAAAALVAHVAQRRRGVRLLPALVLVPAVLAATAVPAVGFYATHVEPYRLRVDRVTFATPLVEAPIRVGVIADIQTRRITGHERDAVARLLAEEPDIVLIAGDLHQGSEADFRSTLEDFRALLAELATAPYGAYVIRGDSEGPGELEALLPGTGVVFLDSEVRAVEVRGQPLLLGGVDTLVWRSWNQEVFDELDRRAGEGLRVLLSHTPDAVLELDGRTVDLAVAGHTHGGQVAVPWFGPLVTGSDVPRAAAAGGLHRVEGTPLYVSTGVGVVRESAPQIRLFARPSVGVIDVVPAG